MPKSPSRAIDLNKIGHGALFKGDKGFLIADFDNRILVPYGKGSNLSYYNRRDAEKMLPDVGHFMEQWIKAAKGGDLNTACNFEYSANMIETMLLGLVAYRAGGRIAYDGKAGKSDNEKANGFISKEYREGWAIDG